LLLPVGCRLPVTDASGTTSDWVRRFNVILGPPSLTLQAKRSQCLASPPATASGSRPTGHHGRPRGVMPSGSTPPARVE
jgi:hypothetical protein